MALIRDVIIEDDSASSTCVGAVYNENEGHKEESPSGCKRLIMVDESSNDVEAVYIDSQDEEDPDGGEKRPIMILLRRLIRNKQNTVMTNAQIIDILQSEFNICVKTSHELEVDIYIKIIKKYLKDWPQWEELERISTKLHNIKDFEAVTKVLDHKYKNLKEYLGVMLEAAKPLAKEAVKNLTPGTVRSDENIDSSDVVMEIQCTREQLNHLIYRRPQVSLNNSIFNISKVPPSRISLKALSLKEMISGWCLRVSINLPHFVFVREVNYKLKHILVNMVRKETLTDINLNTCLQMQQTQKNKKNKQVSKKLLKKQFNEILEEYATHSTEQYADIRTIFDVLMSEVTDMCDKYTVPGHYRKCASKYKYVRYLYVDNEPTDDAKYDLQLEETLAPIYYYHFGKVGLIQKPLPQFGEWLKIECLFCKNKLSGTGSLKDIIETHFIDVHQNELDWQCTHCKQSYSIDVLANNKWAHEC